MKIKVKTWWFEALVVWGSLLLALIIFGKVHDWREWLAALGVGLGFHHASVASRLQEAEEARPKSDASVTCVKWLNTYWIGKELAWVLYFLATGAVSALVGCAVFLVHPFWRRWYRSKFPRARRAASDALQQSLTEANRFLAMLDQAFPDVSGEDVTALLRSYGDRIEDLRRRAEANFTFADAAKYDLERKQPASQEAHDIWARIVNKPHYALPVIQGLLKREGNLTAIQDVLDRDCDNCAEEHSKAEGAYARGLADGDPTTSHSKLRQAVGRIISQHATWDQATRRYVRHSTHAAECGCCNCELVAAYEGEKAA